MANNTFEGLLQRHENDLALVIGNGINRFAEKAGVNAWEDLLGAIARNCGQEVSTPPKGTALTEFFDVIELRSGRRPEELQAEFCRLMAGWLPLPHHQQIIGWATRHNAPVLTTNFDDVLSKAAGCEFQLARERGFTAFYPWGCHFARQRLDDPCTHFGIWHINGMARYRQSVRLGLSHFMGSVQRARGWLHGSDGESLFAGKDRRHWVGARSWLHLVFNKPLMIFGLGLDENEVFLRWLLIERARYFRMFEERRHPAWYVYVHDPKDERQAGKRFFLEALGINCVQAPSYSAIYESVVWPR